MYMQISQSYPFFHFFFLRKQKRNEKISFGSSSLGLEAFKKRQKHTPQLGFELTFSSVTSVLKGHYLNHFTKKKGNEICLSHLYIKAHTCKTRGLSLVFVGDKRCTVKEISLEFRKWQNGHLGPRNKRMKRLAFMVVSYHLKRKIIFCCILNLSKKTILVRLHSFYQDLMNL